MSESWQNNDPAALIDLADPTAPPVHTLPAAVNPPVLSGTVNYGGYQLQEMG